MLKVSSEPPKEETKKKDIDPPFLLEITPQKLVVPPEGLLEVKIKNTTKDEQKVEMIFDSFYFLIDSKNGIWEHSERVRTTKPWCRTTSWYNRSGVAAVNCKTTLYPGGTFILTIGSYDREPYPKRIFGLYGSAPEFIHPFWNRYYNYERPEGFLKIKHQKLDSEKWAVREHQLFLEKETPKYGYYQERLQAFRKDQERMARWGQKLVNEEIGTFVECKKEKDIDWYEKNREYKDNSDRVARETYLLQRRMDLDILSNLEEIDKLSDEEIQKKRLDRRRPIMEKQLILDNEEARKEACLDFSWFEEMGERLREPVSEKTDVKKMEPKVNEKKSEKSKKKDDPEQKKSEKKSTQKPVKEPIEKLVETPEPPIKPSEKKSIQNSTEPLPAKPSEEPKSKAPEVPKPKTPEPIQKPIVQKPGEKKKKKNPCCSIS